MWQLTVQSPPLRRHKKGLKGESWSFSYFSKKGRSRVQTPRSPVPRSWLGSQPHRGLTAPANIKRPVACLLTNTLHLIAITSQLCRSSETLSFPQHNSVNWALNNRVVCSLPSVYGVGSPLLLSFGHRPWFQHVCAV